jgi:hypothetical protein
MGRGAVIVGGKSYRALPLAEAERVRGRARLAAAILPPFVQLPLIGQVEAMNARRFGPDAARARELAAYLTHTEIGVSKKKVCLCLSLEWKQAARAFADIEDRRDDPAFDAALDRIAQAMARELKAGRAVSAGRLELLAQQRLRLERAAEVCAEVTGERACDLLAAPDADRRDDRARQAAFATLVMYALDEIKLPVLSVAIFTGRSRMVLQRIAKSARRDRRPPLALSAMRLAGAGINPEQNKARGVTPHG